MTNEALESLIKQLATLPGIGTRGAFRIAFHILKSSEESAGRLSESILSFRKELMFCEKCAGITNTSICEICNDPDRVQSQLCVIEEPGDMLFMERTGEFKGLYQVLMGSLSPLDGIGPEDLRINQLIDFIEKRKSSLQELFLATNPTLEGDATASYITKRLEKYENLLITRISHGIPTGGSIEFTETSVLARSIRSRRAVTLTDSIT